MSKTPSTTSPWQAALTRLLEWVCIVIMAVMILDVIWGVISRFVLRQPSRWTEELATFLLIWVAMLGGALAHRQGAHLGVTFLVERLEERVARWVTRFCHAMIVLFAAVVMVYGGIALVHDRFRSGQVLAALGWSKAWMYLAVPIAGLFVIGYSVRELLWPTPLPPSEPLQQPTAPSGALTPD